jgi:hypothetical protein
MRAGCRGGGKGGGMEGGIEVRGSGQGKRVGPASKRDALTVCLAPRQTGWDRQRGTSTGGARGLRPHALDTPKQSPTPPHPHVPFRLGPTKASAPWNDAVAATKAATANAPFILDVRFCSACELRWVERMRMSWQCVKRPGPRHAQINSSANKASLAGHAV